MDIMQWFRKRSKKLLIWFGCLLMIGFLLPNFAGNSNRQKQNQTIGHYTDARGKQQDISSQMLVGAARQLENLSALGMSVLSDPRAAGILSNVPDLGGVNRIAELAPCVLFFSDGSSRQLARNLFLQQISQGGWASDETQARQLQNDVIQLTTVNRSDVRRMFLLLLNEAHEAGIQPSSEQIDTLLQLRSELVAGGQLPRLPAVAAVIKRLNITENILKQSIGNYLAIVQYGDMLTGTLALNEQEIKREIRQEVEMESVSGNYVTFSANLFLDKIADSEEADLQSHFDRYKTFSLGQNDKEENPFGFGYKLSDRVQVETLRIDLAKVQETIENEFALNPLDQQEEQVQDYWANHRNEFTETSNTNPEDPTSQPVVRSKPFDQVVTQARDALLKTLARQKAQKLLSQAYKSLTKRSDDPLSEADQEKIGSEYADIAARLSGPDIQIEYERSAFLSYQTAQQFLNFGQTYTAPRDKPEQSLLGLLFSTPALRDAADPVLPDITSVELYETIDALLTFSYGENTSAALLVRVIAVDKEREPETMTDDGSQGQFNPDIAETENNLLLANIKSDVKKHQAYQLAKQQAEGFAAQASADWSVAFAETNRSLSSDPNDPNKPGPLNPTTLQANRDQLNQLYQYASQQNRNSSYFRQAIVRQMNLLRDAAELAQERRETGSVQGSAILERPEELSLLVFQDLEGPAVTENQYVQRRALMSSLLIERNQAITLLTHFNPENIDRRHGFQFVEPEDPAQP